MSKFYVGLDIHCKQTVYVAENEDGTVVGKGRIPTTPEGFRELKDDLGLDADAVIAMESGTVARFVTKCLAAIGLKSIVVHANEVRRKAHRRKQKDR